MKYTAITLLEMREVLRPSNGWIEWTVEQCAALGTREHVFDFPIGSDGQNVLRVMTSIDVKSSVSRPVGEDAIRVLIPKRRKSVRVFRVEGWRQKLVATCQEVLAEFKASTQIGALVQKGVVAPPPAPKYDAIHALLQSASAHLKHPSVYLKVGAVAVQFKLAGPQSKYHGDVLVTDGERYPSNVWYGSIKSTGAWQRSSKVTDDVAKLVDEVAADPVGVCAKYGKLMGVCCFCSLKLTTPESTDAGYGPICAEHFHLPWGSKKAGVA